MGLGLGFRVRAERAEQAAAEPRHHERRALVGISTRTK